MAKEKREIKSSGKLPDPINDLPFKVENTDRTPEGYFKKGNTVWKKADPNNVGRPRKLESPDVLWDHFVDYCEEVDANPWLKHDFKGKDATPVNQKLIVPYTWFGFDNYLFRERILSNLDEYKNNKKNRHSDFAEIITRIDRIIYDRKITGASVGAFNASIIARELKLVDASDITSKGKKIGGTPSKIEVEIVKAKDDDE